MPVSFRPSFALTAWLIAAPCGLSAQVGTDPEKSPYRELTRTTFIAPFVARIDGDGGDFGVGPHNGIMYGATLFLRANRFLSLGLGASHGTLERRIVDPFVELENRDQGIVDQKLTTIDGHVGLNLTGGKTWRRLAPFLSLSGGLAIAGETKADTSGFSFGTRFYFAPGAGVRLAITQRLQFRAEARAMFWKIPYPDSYRTEPPLEPGTPADPNAVITDGRLSEWTHSSWLGFGISWSP